MGRSESQRSCPSPINAEVPDSVTAMVQRFYVETLGCPKNDVDSDKLVGALLADGMEHMLNDVIGISNAITQDQSARGTWITIPEPGTMILFGLGALVIAARKKFRK